MKRILHIKKDVKFFISDEVGHTFTPYGLAMVGGYDKIVVHTAPETSDHKKWLDSIIAQRLNPKGLVVYHCEVNT